MSEGIEITSERKKRGIVIMDTGFINAQQIARALREIQQVEVVVLNEISDQEEIKSRLDSLVKKDMYAPPKIPEFKNYREKYFATRKHRCH